MRRYAIFASLTSQSRLAPGHRFRERLIVNVGIVLVFAAFYLRFLKGP
jgi:hypothetical protein